MGIFDQYNQNRQSQEQGQNLANSPQQALSMLGSSGMQTGGGEGGGGGGQGSTAGSSAAQGVYDAWKNRPAAPMEGMSISPEAGAGGAMDTIASAFV